MPTSTDVLIAEEIKTALNARSVSESWGLTAERVYVADWDIKDELGTMQVGVWPGESASEIWQRDLQLKQYKIGLTFAQHIARFTLAEVDALMDLVGDVVEWLELQTVVLDDSSSYWFTAWEYLGRFNEASLDRKKGADGIVRYTGVFAAAIVFDYQADE